jgi:hypothetical protein
MLDGHPSDTRFEQQFSVEIATRMTRLCGGISTSLDSKRWEWTFVNSGVLIPGWLLTTLLGGGRGAELKVACARKGDFDIQKCVPSPPTLDSDGFLRFSFHLLPTTLFSFLIMVYTGMRKTPSNTIAVVKPGLLWWEGMAYQNYV